MCIDSFLLLRTTIVIRVCLVVDSNEIFFVSVQAALAESNLNFLQRNAPRISPLNAERAVYEETEQLTKRVKVENPDDLTESKTDEYYSRGADKNSEADEDNDASSTENYEPLNFKSSWHPQRERSEDSDYPIGRTSLTVEVGAVTRHSPSGLERETADYLKPQAVNGSQ